MNQPLVSVIIPVYNTEKYLRECLDSVVNQTLRDFEVICVDDGSTDGSLAILREYEAKDSRFRVFTQEKSTAGAARNNGLLHASGRYCIFLDSDDFFDPNLLKKSYEKAISENADIVAFHFSRYYEDGTTEQRKGIHLEWLPGKPTVFNYRDCPDYIMTVVNTSPWNRLYRTAFLLDHALRYDEISSSNDLSFTAVTVASAEHVSFLDESLVYYRVGHGGTISSTKNKTLGNVMIAVKSGVEQVSALPYFGEIKDGVVRFAIESFVYAVGYYISDFSDPISRQFCADIKAYFHTPLFDDCSAERLHSKKMYAYFRCMRDKTYNDLIQMTVEDAAIRIQENTMPSVRLKNLVSHQPLIVSLSSSPAGIHAVGRTIESLKHQTVTADKIILWLAEEQFPSGADSLPGALLSAVDEHFEIRRCRDLQAHRKYYYAMLEHPESLIITAYDSILYPNDLIETLLRSYLKFPYAVSAMRAHLIRFDQEGNIAPYNEWEAEHTMVGSPAYCLLADGAGGVLYPPHCMHRELFNTEAIQALCPCAEDLWLKAMQVLNGTPVVIAAAPVPLRCVDGTPEPALWSGSPAESGNDEALARILAQYEGFSGGNGAITQRIWLSFLSFRGLHQPVNTRNDSKELLRMKASNEEQKKRADRLQRDLDSKKKESETLRYDLDCKRKEAETLRRDLDSKRKESETLRYDLDCVHQSVSFRVGRAITWLPRKLRGGVQCFREHGVGYTVRRTLYHMGLWKDEEALKKRKKTVKGATKVSVILPVYNVKPYIGRCIASLQNQTLSDLEFIFVDDCSTDDSMAAVEAWAEQDGRVHILRNEFNMGAGYSRNRGIEASHGEYISFVDADDYLSPDFYELLYAAATAGGGHDIAKSLRCLVDGATGEAAPPNKKLNDRIRASLIAHKPLYTAFTYEHLCALYHHRLFADPHVRYGATRNSEDITFLLRCCYQTDDIVFEESARYYYVQREGSIVHGDPVKIAHNQMNAMVERIAFLNEKGFDDTALQYVLARTNDCILRFRTAQQNGRADQEDFDCLAARIRELVGAIPGALQASGAWPEVQSVLRGHDRVTKDIC